ncbi:YwhD family protein [Pullulanibacillus sp. KACC 23026]|uniref:YwhD family protein n=1 Tax=Pullulanibacillus sp. KACC 23026 TaxID=3028315 RepID=UPI0023AF8BB3|nr:YwhD family protein [Pullulanibacillus sp. KACC 23026]WEG11048.1 YwhD family protein [Pullulanibacillus sp. KACC 23026]
MSEDISGNKSKEQFTILSGDSTDGDGSFGVGTINLDNVTPVIIDPQQGEAYIDMQAMHGRSKIEKRVRFSPDREAMLENSNLYWIVWVVVDRDLKGPKISGIAACELRVSKEERRIRPGYKSMPEHVNNMDKALKGHIILDKMDAKSKDLLKDFLVKNHSSLLENTREELKNALSI